MRERAAPRSAAVRGLLWMTAASALYAATYIVVRELSARFSSAELVFFRALFGVIVMSPWLMRAGLGALRTARWRLYALRAVLTYSGMVCWFYGLANVPLADATAILFTSPFFTVISLQMFGGERVPARRWAAIGAGFAGVVMILRPGMATLVPAMIGIVYTAIAYGVSNASTRALATTENKNAVVFYMFALMLPLSIGPAAAGWTTPVLADGPLLLAFAFVAVASIQCMTRALASAPGAVVMPAWYAQLPFTAGFAYALYGETPDGWTWAGAATICLAGYWVSRAEGRGA